jgi:hypothetical protein
VRLLKNKPYAGKSEYGSYLLYSVEVDGEERALFVDVDVHNKIQDLKVQAGDQIVLTKTTFPDGRKIKSQIIVEAVATQPRINDTVCGDRFREIMEQSLREAIAITGTMKGVPFQNEDIQKIASCLFIART